MTFGPNRTKKCHPNIDETHSTVVNTNIKRVRNILVKDNLFLNNRIKSIYNEFLSIFSKRRTRNIYFFLQIFLLYFSIPVSQGSCRNGFEPTQCTFLLQCYINGGTVHRECGGLRYTCCPPTLPPRRTFPYQLPRSFSHNSFSSSTLWPSPSHSAAHNFFENDLSPSFTEHAFTKRHHQNYDNRNRIYYNDGGNRHENRNKIFYNEPECGVRKMTPSNVLSKRIIGGDEADFAELPWQAHIRIGGYQCGGVLVNRYFVVTAAHCVFKAPLNKIKVYLGEFDTKDRQYEPFPAESLSVVEMKHHPQFNYMQTQPDRFDVAVLRLSRPVSYRENISPICLPPPGQNFEGRIGIVAGWGKTDNSFGKTGTNILQKARVPIIPNERCLAWHHRKNIKVKLKYEMFCAGHPSGKMDACLGDSGGPLVVMHEGRWTLAGITSAGFGCAVDHQPGIYHKVAVTSGWIATEIRP